MILNKLESTQRWTAFSPPPLFWASIPAEKIKSQLRSFRSVAVAKTKDGSGGPSSTDGKGNREPFLRWNAKRIVALRTHFCSH